MPPHEQALALLRRRARAGVRPVEQLTVPEARAACARYVALQEDPEPVARVVRLLVPPAGLAVRIYYPHTDGPLPALVHCHGGGWVSGDLSVYDSPSRTLANRTGCAVAVVDYRRAPEHRFPGPLDDCYTALCWIAEHATSLNLDPARIGVCGDSAGGNLAAAACLRAREHGPELALQVLIYPVTDYNLDTPSYHEYAEGFGLQRESMRWYWRHYLPGPAAGADPLASPLRAPDLSGVPPAVVLTAECDPLRDDGERYAARLRAAGVPVRSHRFDGMIHAAYLMAGALDQAGDLIGHIGHEVRHALVRG
jgi:acetyl esterase